MRREQTCSLAHRRKKPNAAGKSLVGQFPVYQMWLGLSLEAWISLKIALEPANDLGAFGHYRAVSQDTQQNEFAVVQQTRAGSSQ
jgi:hypothetical protein